MEREQVADGGLSVRGLSKAFPGTLALSDVDLDVRPGEVHSLSGGNGSGKSTLIKILAGVYQGERGGRIRVGRLEVGADEMSPVIAHQAGVRVVHQDVGVFPDMTVAENIALGHGFPVGVGGHVKARALRRRTAELIDRFEIRARPETLIRDLPRASQTEVAIARALQDQDETNRGVLILDEPTAALPEHEVDLLLTSLRRYAADGQTIVYVSHRLDEVLDLTERVTVLRDGRKVGTYRSADLDEGSLSELIVGRAVERVFQHMPGPTEREAVLAVRNVVVGPLRDVSLTVSRGEVVGIAGLLGSGRTELLEAIYGDVPVDSGTIELAGAPIAFRHPREAMAAGVAFVPEHREDAVFPDESVYENINVTNLRQYWRGLRLRRGAMRGDGRDLMARFRVKAASELSPMNTVSGGNQQKVVLARWLRREPRLLLLDEPTQGVDVGARAEIYGLLREAVAAGAAALLVASDFEELSQVVDRAVVLHGGRVVAEVSGDDLNPHRLTELSYATDGRRSDAS